MSRSTKAIRSLIFIGRSRNKVTKENNWHDNLAVALNSATSALHVACLALEVGETDIVWTSSNSFVASANCALYCGARVDFVDIEPLSGLISTECLKEKLVDSEKIGKLPKVAVGGGRCGDFRSQKLCCRFLR